MAMPAFMRKRWTANEARKLTAENPRHSPRYEVIDGELLVTPAPKPRHQAIVLAFAIPLRAFTTRLKIGHTMISPADIALEPDTVVQPDIFVAKIASGRTFREWSEIEGLVLVVEVLSPSTERYDRVTKRDYYLRNGVPYLVLDGDERRAEFWRPGESSPSVFTDKLVWLPDGASEAFELDLVEFFREVTGED